MGENMAIDILCIGKDSKFYVNNIKKVNDLPNYRCEFLDESNLELIGKKYKLYFLQIKDGNCDSLSLLNTQGNTNIIVISDKTSIAEKEILLTQLMQYQFIDIMYTPLHFEELLIKIRAVETKNSQIYKEFLDKMDVMAVVTNNKNEITYCNQAFSDETGYDENVIGQRDNVLKSGKHSLMFYNNIKHTLNAGLTWAGTFKNKRKNGSVYKEEASIFPITIDGTTSYGKTAINTTQHEEVLTENKHAEQLATAIQQSLLAEDIYDENIIIRTLYQPLENVSGDIYNLYKLNDELYCIFLADVVGHGIGSALLSTAIIAVANNLVTEDYMPDTFLKALNNRIMGLFNSNELPQTTYFTAAYVVIDIADKKIRFANCGHPKIYLLDEIGVHSLMQKNFFIGMFQNAEYEYGTCDYNSNCTMLMYTDGLSEFSSDMKSDVKYLESKLESFRNKNSELDIIEYLQEEIIKPHETKDDISIISAKLIGR